MDVIDFENAYDFVNWIFFDYMLEIFSFNDKWRT